ncbi:MAG: hypothetical protein JW844_07155 [Candidatus Omnitrophica bacterium]|nr:hypothetical protein [Candidatus Omnitrophota bacterium]
MDDREYWEYLKQKQEEYEALCRRCGACCGVKDGDPCEHLRRAADGTFFCTIYNDRFGLRKTVGGNEIVCVPIRNILHKTWSGKSTCAYVRYAHNQTIVK